MKTVKRSCRVWWAGVLAAITLIAGAPYSAAENRADQHELTVPTADGRTLIVGHRGETITGSISPGLVPIREAVVSNSAYARITGSSFASLQDAELIVGYHLGCAASLESVASGVGVDAGIVPPSVLVIAPQVFDSDSDRQSTVAPKLEVKPAITADLAAGTLADVVIEKISLKDHRPRIDLARTSIKADGCLTGLTIRSYVILTAKSPVDDETVAVYGDPAVI